MPTLDEVVKSVELLAPKQGDVLVIYVDRMLSAAQRDRVARSFHEAAGGRAKIVCVPNDWRVSVVRPGEAIVEPPSLDMGTQLVGPGFEAHDAPIDRRTI